MHPRRAPLTLAVLGALRHIGDKRAIFDVEQLCSRIEVSADAEERLIRDAANDCLICLRERAARAQAAGTLLRASQQSEGGARSILLRAADGSASVEPAELLRAADADR
jgi:hypothetical protein